MKLVTLLIQQLETSTKWRSRPSLPIFYSPSSLFATALTTPIDLFFPVAKRISEFSHVCLGAEEAVAILDDCPPYISLVLFINVI